MFYYNIRHYLILIISLFLISGCEEKSAADTYLISKQSPSNSMALQEILDSMHALQENIPPFSVHIESQTRILEHPTLAPGEGELIKIDLRLDQQRFDMEKTRVDQGKTVQEIRVVSTPNQQINRQQGFWREGAPVIAGIRESGDAKAVMSKWIYGSSYYLIGYFAGDTKPVAHILKHANNVILLEEKENIAGFQCYVIEGKTRHGYYKLWIDPEHDYSIRKAIIQRSPGDIVRGKPTEKRFCNIYLGYIRDCS